MLRGRAEEEWVQAQEETAVHTMRGTRWAEREGELQAHHCLGKGLNLVATKQLNSKGILQMTNLLQIQEMIQCRRNKEYSRYTTNDTLIEYLMDLAEDNDIDYTEVFEDLITLDEVEYQAAEEMKNGGIHRIKHYLGQIIDTAMDDEYYVVDGYGNIREVELSDIENYLEILEEMIEEAA